MIIQNSTIQTCQSILYFFHIYASKLLWPFRRFLPYYYINEGNRVGYFQSSSLMVLTYWVTTVELKVGQSKNLLVGN